MHNKLFSYKFKQDIMQWHIDLKWLSIYVLITVKLNGLKILKLEFQSMVF